MGTGRACPPSRTMTPAIEREPGERTASSLRRAARRCFVTAQRETMPDILLPAFGVVGRMNSQQPNHEGALRRLHLRPNAPPVGGGRLRALVAVNSFAPLRCHGSVRGALVIIAALAALLAS